jgi:hypothetical protein
VDGPERDVRNPAAPSRQGRGTETNNGRVGLSCELSGPYDLAMLFLAKVLVRRIFGGPLPTLPEFEGLSRLFNPDAVSGAALDQVVQDGDWRAARNAIEAAGTDWDLRGHRVAVFAGLADKDDSWFDGWMRAEPTSPAAALIWANVLQNRASRARGSGRASQTSDDQIHSFNVLSDKSADAGIRALELAAPNDPGPIVLLMRTSYASGPGELDDLYAEAVRRDPHNYEAHHLAVRLRCQKWYGSHQQMFQIARNAAEAAPPGHRTVLLPLVAHIEYALLEFAWGDDKDYDVVLHASKNYFTSPAVMREIDGWIAKFRAAEPNSVGLTTVRQWMAMYYSLIGNKAEAKRVFDEMGPYIQPDVGWHWLWGASEYGYLKSWWWANGVGRN